jgi:hypothetical protein
MTIAAGLRFDRGILLCADTQYSAEQKTQETKTFQIDHHGARVVLALAGRSVYARRAVERIRQEITLLPATKLSKDDLQTSIERALLHIFTTHVYIHPDWGTDGAPDFQFVAGIFSPGEGTFLMETEETIAAMVNDKICVGSGGYLGDYLLNRMYLGPKQPLNDAIALATYILHEIKNHDLECGGKSEFIVLLDTGQISPLLSRDITLNEDYASSFNEASTKTFYAVADVEKTDEEMHEGLVKADEVLFLSRISRRESREQEQLVEALQIEVSDHMRMADDLQTDTYSPKDKSS